MLINSLIPICNPKFWHEFFLFCNITFARFSRAFFENKTNSMKQICHSRNTIFHSKSIINNGRYRFRCSAVLWWQARNEDNSSEINFISILYYTMKTQKSFANLFGKEYILKTKWIAKILENISCEINTIEMIFFANQLGRSIYAFFVSVKNDIFLCLWFIVITILINIETQR